MTLNGVLWFCIQGKNGDGELTERGAAAFWRRDGDGGTAERGMGVLVKGRGDSVWPERDPSFPPREGLLRCFYFQKMSRGYGFFAREIGLGFFYFPSIFVCLFAPCKFFFVYMAECSFI